MSEKIKHSFAAHIAVASKRHASVCSFMIISGLAMLFFAILAVMFPYTGDDWAWGSSMGLSKA